MLGYVTNGTAICDDFRETSASLVVDKNGVRAVAVDESPGAGRRARLW